MYNRTSHIAHRTSPDLLPSSGRIREIDSLRGFAILLVTLHHAVIKFPINIFAIPSYYAIVRWCTSVHMPLFFVISGFCFSCKDYKKYLHKKFLRLVIPYVIFSIFDMFPRYFLPSLVNRPRPISESIIKFILYGGEFWFIYTLFIIFVVYPFIFRLASSGIRKMIMLLLLFFMLSFHGTNIGIFCADSVIYYMFFFHLGVTAKMLLVIPDRYKPSALFLPVAFALWMIFLYSVTGFGIITALIGIITCFLAAAHKIFNDVFSRFGRYSLQMYLINGTMLGISRAIICNIFNVYSPPAIILFNVLIDFFVAYLFIKYICTRNKIIRFAMGII